MKKFFVITNDASGNLSNRMLADLSQADSVEVVVRRGVSPRLKNSLLRLAAGAFVRLRWSVERAALLRRLQKAAKRQRVWLLVPNEACFQLMTTQLCRLKKSGVQTVLLLIDPLRGRFPSAPKVQKSLQADCWSRVLTFDPEDAAQYGFTYVNTLYSKQEFPPAETLYHLFYIGSIKDRLADCLTLLEQLQANGVKAWFKLRGTPAQTAQLPAQNRLEQPLRYEQTAALLQQADCILEMTQAGQSGVTLRYYEAVAYNKKLLTNNPNITRMPFYDARYMKIFNTPQDIDWAWVCDGETPDYGYTDQFSPLHLAAMLQKED